MDLRTKIGFPFLEHFDGDDFTVQPAHLLREKSGKFSPIDGVGVQNTEASIALFIRRIGRDTLGLHGIRQRRAEEIVAQPADIGECRRRCNQRDPGLLRHFGHDRKVF